MTSDFDELPVRGKGILKVIKTIWQMLLKTRNKALWNPEEGNSLFLKGWVENFLVIGMGDNLRATRTEGTVGLKTQGKKRTCLGNWTQIRKAKTGYLCGRGQTRPQWIGVVKRNSYARLRHAECILWMKESDMYFRDTTAEIWWRVDKVVQVAGSVEAGEEKDEMKVNRPAAYLLQ